MQIERKQTREHKQRILYFVTKKDNIFAIKFVQSKKQLSIGGIDKLDTDICENFFVHNIKYHCKGSSALLT